MMTTKRNPHRTKKMRRRNLQAPGMEDLPLHNRQYILQSSPT